VGIRVREFMRNAVGKITFWGVMKGLALLFVVVPFLVYVFVEVRRDVLIVDPFGVPKEFAEAGLTPEVMQDRVRARLLEMEAELKDSPLKKDILGSELEETSIPEVELPGTKLGLKTVVEVMRTLLHHEPMHVGGDIVLPMESAPGSLNGSVAPIRITVYCGQGRNRIQSLRADVPRNVDTVVQRAAELALQQVNPFLLSAYLTRHLEFDKAIALDAAVTQDSSQDLPHRAVAFDLWGAALEGEGKREEAVAKYQSAIGLNPKDVFGYFNWGVELVHEDKYEEAIPKYKKATELDPKFADAYDGWGDALGREGRYGEAIAKFQKAAELNPEDALAYFNWGVALANEEKYAEAIAKYEKAIELNPKDDIAYLYRGRALRKMGREAEAQKMFDEVDRVSKAK
jgi:Tfp pilus assembly protein PilF